VDTTTGIYWINRNKLKLSSDVTIVSDVSRISFINGTPMVGTFTYSRNRPYDAAPVATLGQWSKSNPCVKRTPFGVISRPYDFVETRFWDNVKFYNIQSSGGWLINSLDPTIFGKSLINVGSIFVDSVQEITIPRTLPYIVQAAY
jgi:hypothetical protein